jgi:hypothetical protein
MLKNHLKITVIPVVAPELPNYIPDTNIEENGNKKKRLQRKLNNELPNYIEDTNIEQEHKKRQRKLNKELPNYIEEKERQVNKNKEIIKNNDKLINDAKEFLNKKATKIQSIVRINQAGEKLKNLKVMDENQKKVFQKVKETIASSKIANMIKHKKINVIKNVMDDMLNQVEVSNKEKVFNDEDEGKEGYVKDKVANIEEKEESDNISKIHEFYIGLNSKKRNKVNNILLETKNSKNILSQERNTTIKDNVATKLNSFFQTKIFTPKLLLSQAKKYIGI